MIVVNVKDGFEETFWQYIKRDPIEYYFFILDFKENRDQTEILMAMDAGKIEGLALVFARKIVQLRGRKDAVEMLLEHVNIDNVELQAPPDYEDLVTKKYSPSIKYDLVLMVLEKGEGELEFKHETSRLQPRDAERVAEIMRTADPVWWGNVTSEDRKESIEKTFWLGIKQDRKIVAVGNARFEDWGSNIGVIATESPFRNRGYATSIVSALVKEILKRSSTALIHVVGNNYPALHVYSKVGFRPYRQYLLMRAKKVSNRG